MNNTEKFSLKYSLDFTVTYKWRVKSPFQVQKTPSKPFYFSRNCIPVFFFERTYKGRVRDTLSPRGLYFIYQEIKKMRSLIRLLVRRRRRANWERRRFVSSSNPNPRNRTNEALALFSLFSSPTLPHLFSVFFLCDFTSATLIFRLQLVRTGNDLAIFITFIFLQFIFLLFSR